jgi:DEAD/DEAH box helicase domain-containing protein
MARVVVFDLETRKHAKELHPDSDVGWEALRRGEGGISALAIYDSQDDWTYLYDDHTIQQAARHLESADVAVGFRSEGFDVPAIEGVLGRSLTLRRHEDLYVNIVREAAHRGIVGARGDFTLDTISKLNIGRGKVEHGEHAPELARRGQWAKLFNYCMDDVRITRDLFRLIRKKGTVRIVSGRTLSITLPDWIKES